MNKVFATAIYFEKRWNISIDASLRVIHKVIHNQLTLLTFLPSYTHYSQVIHIFFELFTSYSQGLCW